MNWWVQIVSVNELRSRKLQGKFVIIFKRKSYLIVDFFRINDMNIVLTNGFIDTNDKMSVVICVNLEVKAIFSFHLIFQCIVEAFSLLCEDLLNSFGLEIGQLFFWVTDTKLAVRAFGNFNYGLIFNIRSIKIQRLVVVKLRMKRKSIFEDDHITATVKQIDFIVDSC